MNNNSKNNHTTSLSYDLILPFIKFDKFVLAATSHDLVTQRSTLVLTEALWHRPPTRIQPFFLCTDFLNPFPQEKEHVDHDSHSDHG